MNKAVIKGIRLICQSVWNILTSCLITAGLLRWRWVENTMYSILPGDVRFIIGISTLKTKYIWYIFGHNSQLFELIIFYVYKHYLLLNTFLTKVCSIAIFSAITGPNETLHSDNSITQK